MDLIFSLLTILCWKIISWALQGVQYFNDLRNFLDVDIQKVLMFTLTPLTKFDIFLLIFLAIINKPIVFFWVNVFYYLFGVWVYVSNVYKSNIQQSVRFEFVLLVFFNIYLCFSKYFVTNVIMFGFLSMCNLYIADKNQILR